MSDNEYCWMWEHCPYKSAACRASQPEDDGCYVYRRFKDIFKKQGLLKDGDKEKSRGEWEEPFEHNGKIYHKCNHCHASIPLMLIDNYCSYCGADMRGDGNETDN